MSAGPIAICQFCEVEIYKKTELVTVTIADNSRNVKRAVVSCLNCFLTTDDHLADTLKRILAEIANSSR